jgi:hypothetical protein
MTYDFSLSNYGCFGNYLLNAVLNEIEKYVTCLHDLKPSFGFHGLKKESMLRGKKIFQKIF